MRNAPLVLVLSLIAACGGEPSAEPGDVADAVDAADVPDDIPPSDTSETTDADVGVDGEDADGDALSDVADVADADDAADATDTSDATDADADPVDTADSGDAMATCGNGVVESGEQCDQGELNGQTCESLGLTEGILTCGSDCTFRTGQCAICPNARCEGAEDVATCPDDCRAVDVGVGREHTCAALADGSVRCWGSRQALRAGGLGDSNAPMPVAGLAGLDVVEVAAGDANTCVRTRSGEVWCWGRNGFGESAPDSDDVEVWPPRRIQGLPAVQSLTLGQSHACAAASSDGAAWCWGRAVFGAVGRTVTQTRRAEPAPVAFSGPTRVDALAAGADHTCAWQVGSRAWCWGRSDQHQVGGPDATWQFAPRQVSGNATVAGTGSNHSCATVLNLSMPPQFSGLFCWGSNAYGQLGTEPTDDFIGAQRIAAIRPTLLDGGDGYTCTVDGATGDAACWGANESGQLGDGTVTTRFAPGPTLPLNGDVMVLDAGPTHACAVLDNGEIRCWGDNRGGQIGAGTALPTYATPIAPIGMGGAR